MTVIETKLDETPQGQFKYYMNKNKSWWARELVEKNKQCYFGGVGVCGYITARALENSIFYPYIFVGIYPVYESL